MSNKFRVAISSEFMRADGTLAFPSIDMKPLLQHPQIECAFLPGGQTKGGYELMAKDLENFDAAIIWLERFTRNSGTPKGRLALLRRFGAGLERIDIPSCTEFGVALANSREGVRRPVAVMQLTLILAITGKLLIKDKITRGGAKTWHQRRDHMGVGLIGKTLGLLGAGNTGAELVRLTPPLEMKYIAYDPYADKEALRSLGVELVGLDDLFRRSDILVISCPLTKETHHLVNAERLALMKSTSFLVNGARGGIVDQSALVEALRSGRISGAALDVLEREPPDPGEPILELENVILNPHGLSWTDQCFTDCFAECVDAVFDTMHGRTPTNIVNREIVERSDWLENMAAYRTRFGAA